ALTGRQPAINQYRNAYQELPHEPLFSAVTKFSGRVDEVTQLPHLLPQAFRVATTATPRPVHIDVGGHTGDLIAGMEFEAVITPEPQFTRIPAYRPCAEPESV